MQVFCSFTNFFKKLTCVSLFHSSLPSLDANENSPNPNQGSPCSAGTFSMSPPSSASSPLSVLPSVVSPQSAQEQIFDYMVHMQHTKEATPSKNRKKTKPKTQPKARTIKFHEYKVKIVTSAYNYHVSVFTGRTPIMFFFFIFKILEYRISRANEKDRQIRCTCPFYRPLE